MKYKIIILAAVVAGFILLLFVLDIIAGGGSGNMSGHLIALEAMQNYYKLLQHILITISTIKIWYRYIF